MSYGARDNLNFESLSSTSGGKFFFLATEESLLQDGRISSHKTASIVRVVLYNNQKPIKEFGYSLETVPIISVGGLTVGETGLVDIAAIDENNFYSIERSYLPLAKKTIVRIFRNRSDEKTTDILSTDSIKKEIPTTITKTLIANFDDFTKNVDNIEGVCFGPNLSNGHQTLIFVSDNNFSKSQKTQFMAFEIIP